MYGLTAKSSIQNWTFFKILLKSDEGFGSAKKALNEKVISSRTPIISLACAHPSKFPDVIKKAINIEPQLPDHLKELMVSKEYFKVIGNDTKFIKNYLKEKMRS